MKKVLFFAAVLATTVLTSCDKEDKEWLQGTVGNGIDNLTSKPATENTTEAETADFQTESNSADINN